MSELFKKVLEEASKRVEEWPDWKKSEALKLSEQSNESKGDVPAQPKNEDSNRANCAAAGK